MRVGIIGNYGYEAERARALRAMPNAVYSGNLDLSPDDPPDTIHAFLDQTDAVIVAVPTSAHHAIAEAAAKHGVHVFLEWAPATSVRECEALVRLSEEAGVEVGVSRPLRFHPLHEHLASGWHASLMVFSGPLNGAVSEQLADTVDLCTALSGSTSVQRIEAEAVRSEGVRPAALAYSLRFHNGAYAQVSFGQRPPDTPPRLYLAGGDTHLEVELLGDVLTKASTSLENATSGLAFESASGTSLIERETCGFVEALIEGRPPPVTVLDGLSTMRLVERVMERLR